MLKRKSKQSACRIERSQTLGGRPACAHSLAPELPPNFAERLLQLELQLETNCCLSLVNSLMELYQQAIEYYEHKGDCKYLDLQTRMHKMLLRQDVLSVLSKECHAAPSQAPPQVIPEEPASVEQTQELLRKKKEDLSRSIRPQATELLRSESAVLPVQVTRSLNHLFDAHENTSTSTAKLARLDKERMDEVLRNRLSMRISSRKNSRRNSKHQLELDMLSLTESPYASLPTSRPWSEQVSPRAGSTTGSSDTGDFRIPNFDELEKKLEELMERCYAQKAEKIAEVRRRYEAELQELQREGPATGFMLQVLEQTRKNMEKEIHEVGDKCDQQRREEVQQLRIQFQ